MSGRKCPAKVYDSGAMSSHTCGRAAAFEFGGRWFCKTHHPPTVKAKDEARHKAYTDKFNAEMARNAAARKAAAEQARRAACFDDLLEALQRLMQHANWMESCSHDDEGIKRDIERASAAIAKAEGTA